MSYSHIGMVAVRVLNKGGEVNVRATDILQFIDNEDANTNTNTNTNTAAAAAADAATTVSFLHEDAFGVGDEDCVCRGAKIVTHCPTDDSTHL